MATLYAKQEAELHHFSGLLFSGDRLNTVIEWGARAAIIGLGLANPGGIFTPAPGAQSLVEVGLWMCAISAFTRAYNAWLEYTYAKKPQYRTQPPVEHALRSKTDLVGRELTNLESQNMHDRRTLLLDAALVVALFTLNPGFFPGRDGVVHGSIERALRLLVHQYLISFTMYWAHRAGHVVPYKWANVHGVHHQSTHPLSRVTYQAHFLDNFMNAIYGHTFAQFLCPLDYTMYWACHVLRVMESLEKHSGLSCHYNVAHNLQRWLPYSQMPHHHDLHHEGSKRCNFTFSASGGLWDALFGTRKPGRAKYFPDQASAYDQALLRKQEAERAEEEEALALAKAPAPADDELTAAQLAEHASVDSCWIAIGGAVYDVTSYMKEHPGGEQTLLDLAGRDATTEFEDVGHTADARALLAKHKVGSLAGAIKTSIKVDTDSFWNGLFAVHAPIAVMCCLVACTRTPGAVPVSTFCLSVLVAEIAQCLLAK
ncbi:hypothetical protein KFE25_006849 [Diacronema lutheri]|uniref:Cytochrome b5 heme-binding domain-containing protein n=1 Tax=Diacronema lutheri TaxID=2081491 RepID=A0A8J6CAM2_DIALT|nr:hypothetical protein KFE25_006849 [Diacronema lutheri]